MGSQGILRKCSACGRKKGETEFRQKNRSKKLGYSFRTTCRECRNKDCQRRTAGYKARDPLFHRRNDLRRKYALTQEEYEDLLRAQGGGCAICRTTVPGGRGGKHFHVDHSHATGKTRALLCTNCNVGLGKFRDDPDLLSKAIQYLKDHES